MFLIIKTYWPLSPQFNSSRLYGTLPGKHPSSLYRNQPGRIENFMPGNSSVVDRERKDVSKRPQSISRQIIVIVYWVFFHLRHLNHINITLLLD